jgi:hypothetical protein
MLTITLVTKHTHYEVLKIRHAHDTWSDAGGLLVLTPLFQFPENNRDTSSFRPQMAWTEIVIPCKQ